MVYALPMGYGQTFLSHSSRLVDEVLGGWRIGMAGVAYSGFPETATGGNNNSNSYGNARPNQYRPIKIRNRSLTRWYGADPSTIPCGVDANGNAIDNGVCAFG